ncbi:MAG: fatty acid hydroxylase, partial [Flammeovirgaceae bacterium]|nr:fatty acid hydroxylase [Flammeovirgaceae bacterium]
MTETVLPKNKGTKQLFKNPILESLTRTHIAVPLTVFFTYAAV